MRGRNFEIDGKLYKPDEFQKIPVKEINPEMAATRVHNWGISFQGHNAPYSNLYHCEIKGKDGKMYNSAEQYYCSVMAKYHNKMDTMRLIEATNNPYTIKAIAKKIWRSPEWVKTNEKVMEDIIMAKFTQNEDLKTKLLNAPGKVFRECTRCPYWGTGLFLQNAEAGEIVKQGYKNKMGEILQKVRDNICANVGK